MKSDKSCEQVVSRSERSMRREDERGNLVGSRIQNTGWFKNTCTTISDTEKLKKRRAYPIQNSFVSTKPGWWLYVRTRTCHSSTPTYLNPSPRRSLTLSGCPRFPAIVEKRPVTDVRLPISEKRSALLYLAPTSVVTSKYPCAPAPFAWTVLSGYCANVD